jgi:protein-S-isoprenylcysteine O-methyltransferase Ste14
VWHLQRTHPTLLEGRAVGWLALIFSVPSFFALATFDPSKVRTKRVVHFVARAQQQKRRIIQCVVYVVSLLFSLSVFFSFNCGRHVLRINIIIIRLTDYRVGY